MSAATAWLATALATALGWFGVYAVLSGAAALSLSAIVSIAVVVLMAWWLGARAVTSIALASGLGCALGWSSQVAPANRSGWWTLSVFAVLVVAAIIAYFVATGAVSRRGRD